jgi:hypothetical protein
VAHNEDRIVPVVAQELACECSESRPNLQKTLAAPRPELMVGQSRSGERAGVFIHGLTFEHAVTSLPQCTTLPGPQTRVVLENSVKGVTCPLEIARKGCVDTLTPQPSCE